MAEDDIFDYKFKRVSPDNFCAEFIHIIGIENADLARKRFQLLMEIQEKRYYPEKFCFYVRDNLTDGIEEREYYRYDTSEDYWDSYEFNRGME